ncbi:MAG: hypothetical protein ACFFA3_07815 [Promethearchaeota archaeon]
MCKGFSCLDCPAFTTTHCYYYGKDFMDYYKKVRLERYNAPNKYYHNLEIVEFKT